MNQLRKTVVGYGKTAVVVHCGVSMLSTGLFYSALTQHVDVIGLLGRFGATIGDEFNVYSSNAGSESDLQDWDGSLLSEQLIRSAHESISELRNTPTNDKETEQLQQQQESALLDVPKPEMALYGRGSMLAIAYMCTRAIFSVRAPLTLALTPIVRRFFVSKTQPRFASSS